MGNRCLQLVLIPWPVMGHIQIVEFANLIIHRHDLLPPGTTLSVTVLLMKLPDYIDTVSCSFVELLCASSSATVTTPEPHLNFIQLPPTDPTPEWSSRTRGFFIHNLVLSQRSNVADFLHAHKSNIAGVVIDMLCTSMIDVATEVGLPAYVFCTSPASFLGSMIHLQALHDDQNQDVPELRNSCSDVSFPCFSIPVPPKVLSSVLVDRRQWLNRFLHYARDYGKANGIIVNTFMELETYALKSFTKDSAYGTRKVPPVYHVGPIINHGPSPDSEKDPTEALEWLDRQPMGSVVFICFGSQGSLKEDQIHELAVGLEKSKVSFLWSLRKQSSDDKKASFPSEYESYKHVLPEGFLERTGKTGKVTGWVPQMKILSHGAVGGFVSHCGWNSVLESLWCGVPVATWPLHSEQQMNAFQLVRELGLAVEIELERKEDDKDGGVVSSKRIEMGIRELMESGSEVRKKVREIGERGRRSVEPGGSSYLSFNKLVDDILNALPNQQ